MNFLFVLYFIFFLILAWKNFKLGFGLLIVTLPSYLIRFEILGIPTNLLELSFMAVFFVWVFKYFLNDIPDILKLVVENKLLTFFIALFFLSSIIGIFVSDEWFKSTGHWRAFFLEPMLFFLIYMGRHKEISGRELTWFLALSTFSISVVAILQKISPIFYPTKLLYEETFGRVTSFFTTPNAIGLYLLPILLLVLTTTKGVKKRETKFLLSFLVLSFMAIFFTFSQGTWIALGVGLIVFIYLFGNKKIAFFFVLLGIVFSFLVTPIRQAVLFQDVSGQNRLTIWEYSTDYLTENPKNFIFGTGIRQWFRKIQKPFYFEEGYNIERLTFPHNIFLNFWTEIGLFGMIGFIGILYFVFNFSYLIYKYKDKIVGAGLLSVWISFVTHGLVDVPYFKNDLAFLFWVLVAITCYYYYLFLGYEKKYDK